MRTQLNPFPSESSSNSSGAGGFPRLGTCGTWRKIGPKQLGKEWQRLLLKRSTIVMEAIEKPFLQVYQESKEKLVLKEREAQSNTAVAA